MHYVMQGVNASDYMESKQSICKAARCPEVSKTIRITDVRSEDKKQLSQAACNRYNQRMFSNVHCLLLFINYTRLDLAQPALSGSNLFLNLILLTKPMIYTLCLKAE